MAHTYDILPKNIPQIISDVISQVSNNLYDELGTDIQFLHGTWASIRSRIVEDASGTVKKNTRFPLVCLVQVFEEKFKSDSEFSEVSLTLLVCNNSDQTWYSEDRYTNNYIPILYPIYAEIMAVLNESPYFVGYKEKYYTHTKADDLHLPENNDNKLPECLDGLWIKDLKLILDDKCLPVQYAINTSVEFDGFTLPNPLLLRMPFTIEISDTDGIVDGTTFYMNVSNNIGISSVLKTTDESKDYVSVTMPFIKVTNRDLVPKSIPMICEVTLPLAGTVLEQTIKVNSISALKNDWVNFTNTSDTITNL